MMENNEILATPINDEETVLALPIKKKVLGEFISNLLGQQQSIERSLDVKFDIDHAWLMNLHEMISQRIHQQANAHLTYFSSIIYFKGGLKRTFTSVEAFESYSENKNLMPIGIKIIWIYLISFPSKEYPEKQQITFSAQIRSLSDSVRYKYIISRFFDYLFDDPEISWINYQIDHTERTWGDDIESIISNQTSNATRRINNISYNIFRAALSVVIFSIVISYGFHIEKNRGNKFRLSELYNALQQGDPYGINEKFDYLVNAIAFIVDRGEIDAQSKLMIIVAVSIFISSTICVISRRKIYSFLAISKESEKYREQKLRQEKRSVLILVGSFFLSVLSGIIGNYGFSWLTR